MGLAAGEAQHAMLLSGMQPQAPQNSWLLNILTAQQSLRPSILQAAPNMFAQQGYQGDKYGNIQAPGGLQHIPHQAAFLIQQLQQSQAQGQSYSYSYKLEKPA